MNRVLFALFFSSLCALPVGNPAAPRLIKEGVVIPASSWASLRIGYEGDFVVEGREKRSLGHKRIDNLSKDAHFGNTTLNFLNRLDLFGAVGEARLEMDWRTLEESIAHEIQMETKYDLAWEAGGKALLLELGKAAFSFGGRYRQESASLLWMTKDGTPVNSDAANYTGRSWQLDMGLSYEIDFLSPYIGALYLSKNGDISHAGSSISDDGAASFSWKEKNPWGLFLGVNITKGKIFFLGLEARLFAEEAFSVFADFRF